MSSSSKVIKFSCECSSDVESLRADCSLLRGSGDGSDPGGKSFYAQVTEAIENGLFFTLKRLSLFFRAFFFASFIVFFLESLTHAQDLRCQRVGGNPTPTEEVATRGVLSLWPTGDGRLIPEEILGRTMAQVATLIRRYRPTSWRGGVADIEMRRGAVSGSEQFPRTRLSIEVSAPFYHSEGSLEIGLSSCRVVCGNSRPGFRLLFRVDRSSGDFLGKLEGVAYDFCLSSDARNRPNWNRMRTFVTVYRGDAYDDRMTAFLRAQGHPLMNSMREVYELTLNRLVSAE